MLASAMWLGTRGASVKSERGLSRIPPPITALLGYSAKFDPEDGVPEGLERLLDLILETALNVWPQPGPMRQLQRTLELVKEGALQRGASAASQLKQLLSSLPEQYSLEKAISTLDQVSTLFDNPSPLAPAGTALEQVWAIRGRLYMQGELYKRLACNEIPRTTDLPGEGASYEVLQSDIALGLLIRRHAALSFALDPQKISGLTQAELLNHIRLRDFAGLYSAVMLTRQFQGINPQYLSVLCQDIKQYSAKAFECFRDYLWGVSESRALGGNAEKISEQKPLNPSICALWKFCVCSPLVSLKETEPTQMLLDRLDKATKLRLLSLNALYVSHVIDTLSRRLLPSGPPVPATAPSERMGPRNKASPKKTRKKYAVPVWAKFFEGEAAAHQQFQRLAYGEDTFQQFLNHLEAAVHAGEEYCAAGPSSEAQNPRPLPDIAESVIKACMVSCKILESFLSAASDAWHRSETSRCCTALRHYSLSVTWVGRLYACYLQICFRFSCWANRSVEFPHVWQALPAEHRGSRDLVGFIEFLLPAEVFTTNPNQSGPRDCPGEPAGAWPQNEYELAGGRDPNVALLDGSNRMGEGDDWQTALDANPMPTEDFSCEGSQWNSWMDVVD